MKNIALDIANKHEWVTFPHNDDVEPIYFKLDGKIGHRVALHIQLALGITYKMDLLTGAEYERR